MCDGPPVGAVGGPDRIDVDPLVVTTRFGEAVDARLVDLDPAADPQVDAGQRQDLVQSLDRARGRAG